MRRTFYATVFAAALGCNSSEGSSEGLPITIGTPGARPSEVERLPAADEVAVDGEIRAVFARLLAAVEARDEAALRACITTRAQNGDTMLSGIRSALGEERWWEAWMQRASISDFRILQSTNDRVSAIAGGGLVELARERGEWRIDGF